jgi:hypothetical protein
MMDNVYVFPYHKALCRALGKDPTGITGQRGRLRERMAATHAHFTLRGFGINEGKVFRWSDRRGY